MRKEVILQWVREGLTNCTDIAKEMGLTKGRVSQLATQLIKAGKLRKRKNEYEIVQRLNVEALRLDLLSLNEALNAHYMKCPFLEAQP